MTITAVSAPMAALVLSTSPVFSAPLQGLAACPEAAQELPELLASAMQREGLEGEVDAAFDVDGAGVVRSIVLRGPRQYLGRVRSALESMDCRAGVPQRYLLKIRFSAPALPTSALTADRSEVSDHPR